MEIHGVLFEAFLNGERQASTFVGQPRERGESTLVDFSAPVNEMASSLHKLVPAGVLAEVKATHGSEFDFRVSWVHARMRPGTAVTLAADPLILAADPISDLEDALRNRAADVRIIDAPHLLEKKRILNGGTYYLQAA